MKPKELKQQRVTLFRDAASLRRPARVPHLANAVTWKIFNAGHTLPEAMQSFDVMRECVVHFLDRYPVDALIDCGIRNQFNVTDAFDREHSYYYYTEETVGIRDHAHCTLETLSDYLADPERYLWERALPAKYPDWNEKPLSAFQQAFDEYLRYTMFIIKMGTLTGGTYGLPGMSPNNPMKGAITFGIEELLANLLGIRGLSVGMRRDPGRIRAFIEEWDEKNIRPAIARLLAGKDGPDMKYCFDSSLMMLAQNILNNRQFEAYYWPSLRPLLDAYAQKRKNVRIFVEGSMERFYDYFADLPKGVVTLHLERDDPFEVRKRLPNVAIMGGMTSAMLSDATPDACVAHAKRLIDELGRDGGFILSEDKMLSCRNDARAENFKAVCDFVNGYWL